MGCIADGIRENFQQRDQCLLAALLRLRRLHFIEYQKKQTAEITPTKKPAMQATDKFRI